MLDYKARDQQIYAPLSRPLKRKLFQAVSSSLHWARARYQSVLDDSCLPLPAMSLSVCRCEQVVCLSPTLQGVDTVFRLCHILPLVILLMTQVMILV
jgi:hypothetical protein